MKPGDIRIKNAAVLAGLMNHRFDPKLVQIVLWLVNEFGLLFTETWRTARHPGDLHATEPVRAVDIRSWVYSDPQKVADAVNTRWQYDPARPKKVCALLHDAGNGMHFHIQVHPNTTEKKE